jgi:hypothetical protein
MSRTRGRDVGAGDGAGTGVRVRYEPMDLFVEIGAEDRHPCLLGGW